MATTSILLKTNTTSKYYALYISQVHSLEMDLIAPTKMATLLNNDVVENLLTDEWKANYNVLKEKIQPLSDDLPDLDKLIQQYQAINSWACVVNTYSLIAIVSKICQEQGARTSFVNKCIESCISKNLIQYVIISGGWFTIEKTKLRSMPKNKSAVMWSVLKYGLAGTIGAAIAGAAVWLFKSK